MAHDKWFISDTHFFHEKILTFNDVNGHKLRPFKTLEEMHEFMIERWNDVVKFNDYVYHLGDVTFQYHGPFNNLMKRLKGKKRLVIGNHDKIWNKALINNFEKADLWKGFSDYNFTATHIPMILDSLRDGCFNVHGHTHSGLLEDTHYINVCVETRNYTPVNIDEIAAEIKKYV